MIYDLIIIGAGPAGITAAIYAARQKIKVLLIAKELGGQIAKKAVDITNYPGFPKISGMELIEKFKNHLESENVQFKTGEVEKLEKKDDFFYIKTKKEEEFLAKTVIVASGANPRPLNVPGEKEFIGKGVSYCSLCDGPIFVGKTVAVVGGGNAGFESAIFLSSYAKKIYILEYTPKINADKTNQEILKASGKAEIITNANIKEIKGDKFVKSLIYQDNRTKEEKELFVEGVFIEIGTEPATSFLNKLVDFNDKKEIKVDFETFQTKTPGLFAAGDINAGRFKQIITACGEGAKTALAAYQFLKSNWK